MDTLTPMLQQYHQVKSRHKDCILFFRLGDFYEMFADDARTASPILDVVLTSRDAGRSGRIPMCGIPYHAADSYISRLIKAGLKVAICEQVEDPALAKGLVRRDVIRVVTAGTYIDDTTFEARCLAAISIRDKQWGIAFTDTSSGTIQAAQAADAARARELLAKLPVYECVFPEEQEREVRSCLEPLLLLGKMTLSPFESWCFNTDIGTKALTEHFGTHSLSGFGLDGMDASVSAAGALLEYMRRMHHQPLRHIHKVSVYTDADYVFISPAACAGLELDGLMKSIDHTLTSFGRRRLKDWVFRPLNSVPAITRRQEAVTLLRDDAAHREELEGLLRNIPDIEKSVSRISCGTGSPKDLLALRQTLLKIPALQKTLKDMRSGNGYFRLDDIPDLRDYLEAAVSPDIPLSHPEGKII